MGGREAEAFLPHLRWMYETKNPILDGLAPTGAELNTRDQLSANDPTTTVA